MKKFLNSFQDLVTCFDDKFGISGAEFVEYELIEKVIRDAMEDKERLERIKVSTEQKSEALKVGLETFELEITQVFEQVIKGRNMLLQQSRLLLQEQQFRYVYYFHMLYNIVVEMYFYEKFCPKLSVILVIVFVACCICCEKISYTIQLKKGKCFWDKQ